MHESPSPTVVASYARAVVDAGSGAGGQGGGPEARTGGPGAPTRWPSAQRLPFAEVRALWDQAVGNDGTGDGYGDPHVGLALGARMGPGTLHVLGHLVVGCASLVEMVALVERFHPLVSQAGVIVSHRGRRATRIAYRPLVPAHTTLPQQIEAIVIGMVTSARWLAGPSWTPESVSFRHPGRGDGALFTDVVGAPVVFGAAENALIVDNADLDLERALPDPELAALHRTHAERLLRDLTPPSDLPERVRRWLADADLERTGPRDLCDALHLSERSLRRLLHEEGTSWRALLNAARHERARQLLVRTDLTLDRVAQLTGLSGAAVLVRAFSRWEGATPGAYRRAARER
ncbi:AraC family transcriptional regulator [Streptomyces lichenis]|uniref:AraC family transcriptional regulator n=1 Tax=Streptomyces lichenis TaxID=2306967 RepID=A0ABT0IC19_9ACTN|nr:AraC family transcriptional regulator [Streptomyces lichenis]MCK8678879.1 AraC family transcriptional regulator [Streptomyces lichenis]